jgi:hypothetical protein
VRDFVLGKIRRAELGALLQAVISGPDDPELGPLEAELMSGHGRLSFHRDGLVAEGPRRVRYDALTWVSRGPALEDGAIPLELVLGPSEAPIRIRASASGAEVILATLRWIGNTQQKRRIAD